MKLFLIFVVFPIVELFVAIQIGSGIGVLNTVGLLVLFALVGLWVIKREGLRVWNRFVEKAQANEPPTKEIADGMCLLLAGGLFIAPGFVSDVIALILIFPPTRALVRDWMIRRRGLGGFARGRVIKATYGGRVTDVYDVTDTTATETRGELEP